ncbi:uncharacterized protein M421DRAFT_89496 [Didymella exigua CBS 183.55]|uniref:C2H2-type domain-containing protein n=1 Tax=Didymella exigua CBS 183.55 TaxID=1150837 RepID=A0A6A5RXR7_9PLEO|nr:uncharacterized protein M421DRAFT_89496 [Didymella exigua CBS 183.55]KAF1932140.1 hypothetical protein M421DRAFT_89496 [Didymella exigua CBS 183.55]
MSFQQFGDLLQIPSVDAKWSSDYNNYHYVEKQHATSFSVVDDNAYLDNLDDSIMSLQPMQRFMFDASPQSFGLLHANIPLHSQHSKPFTQQWPASEVYRNTSPDRTSISGTSSYTSQIDFPLPRAYHTTSYGNPTDFFHPSQPYHNCEQFSDVTYTSGSSINPKEVEYTHQEPEPTIEEADIDIKQEATVEPEEGSIKCEIAPDTSYREYTDSGIGNSVRDAESVQPVGFKNESDTDSEYSPTSRGGKRRKSAQHVTRGTRRRSGACKDSAVGSPTQNKTGRKPRAASNVNVRSCQDDRRSFPCPLAAYSCSSKFSSKNEWKRHVSTQHIKLGFWRCDLCAPTTDPNDASVLYYNDFNRKDLFTQHLRRMHTEQGSGARHMKERLVNEDEIQEYQTRCYLQLRCAPQQSICPVNGCDHAFFGPTSWEERMEHVGHHMEKDKKNGADIFDVASWKADIALEKYLMNEDLIVWEQDTWKIGGGKPRRTDSESSDDEYN